MKGQRLYQWSLNNPGPRVPPARRACLPRRAPPRSVGRAPRRTGRRVPPARLAVAQLVAEHEPLAVTAWAASPRHASIFRLLGVLLEERTRRRQWIRPPARGAARHSPTTPPCPAGRSHLQVGRNVSQHLHRSSRARPSGLRRTPPSVPTALIPCDATAAGFTPSVPIRKPNRLM
jgi:hypothetical protein